MPSRRSPFPRRILFGSLAILGAAALFAAAFFPTLYREETFTLSADSLPAACTLTVRHPSFGQADIEADLSAIVRPAGGSPEEAGGIITAEAQSTAMRFSPSGRISAGLTPGRTVSFTWRVLGNGPGVRTFSLFLLFQDADNASAGTPFWAHDFTWTTFSGLGDARAPVLICAVLVFLIGFGAVVSGLARTSGNGRRKRHAG
jgi:hypothetical protein